MRLSELEGWTTDVERRLVATEGQALAARTAAAEALAAVGLWPGKIDRLESVAAELQERVQRLEEGGPPPIPVPVAVGPRVPVGADVPPGAEERALISIGVRPVGLTTAAIQAAVTKAASASRVVYLPAAIYSVGSFIRVPAGVTLIGEGTRTLIQSSGQTFFAEGAGVRFTRLKLKGASETWSETNASRGIEHYGPGWLRVDHCDLSGFSYALLMMGAAQLRLEACRVTHSLRAGFGYGLVAASGAWALVTDCELGQCRHALASNGPGTRWEAVHCRVAEDSLVPASVRQGVLDTHPGMTGTFVIERCLIANLSMAGDIQDGTGLVRGNRIENCPQGFRVQGRAGGGFVGLPRDIDFETNEWPGVTTRFVWGPVGTAANITIDGALVETTRRDDLPPLPPVRRLAVAASGGLELR